MTKVTVYNIEGKKVKDIELDDAVFGVAVKPELIQQAILAQRANSRDVISSTKDKSEVRGGGRKPWRQKGTGRARHGSIRSPLWKGGGVTFGPTTDRNFSQKINKKAKRKALLMALSDKAANGKVVVVDNLEIADGKSKQFFTMLKNIKLRGKNTDTAEGTKKKELNYSVLTILPSKEESTVRAARNLKRVSTISADSLNVVDVVKNQYLLLPETSIEAIKKTFAK